MEARGLGAPQERRQDHESAPVHAAHCGRASPENSMNSLPIQEKILFRKRFLYLHLLVGNERSWGRGVWVQAGHSGQETDKRIHIYALLQSH